MEVVEFLWKYGAWTCFFVICSWAVWKGGPTERTMAAILVAGWAASFTLSPHTPGLITLVVEAVSLIAVTWLAIHSRRTWVFFAAASNLCSLVVLVVAQWLHLGAYGYLTALSMFGSYGPLIALGFGVWEYRRMKKKAALLNAAPQ